MKVIWAIDAFEDNKELNSKMAAYLTSVHESLQSEVIPVYLHQQQGLAYPAYESPTWFDDTITSAEGLFKDVLNDYNLKFLKTPVILSHGASSQAGAAEVLTEYSLKNGAQLIVAGNHGRKGFERFILGSFTESLIQSSHIPVCIIGTHTIKTNSPKVILFPTEFGEHSKESFNEVVRLAARLNARIILLHALSMPVDNVFAMGNVETSYPYKGRMMTAEQIVAENIEIQSHKAHYWIQWAQTQNVEASFIFDSAFRPLNDTILDQIKTLGADLVVMEAQSGPLSAAILGSTTRSVIREAVCPVQVLSKKFYEKTVEKNFPEVAP